MYIIGVVLGNDTVRAAVYNEKYRQLAAKEIVCKGEAVVEAADLCKTLLAESGIAAAEVAYIGTAVADAWGCPCDAAAAIERLTGIKTVAENVINAEALGEAYFAGDVGSLIVLSVGDTVECGIVVDKRVYTSAACRGGKVAHMVINLDGYECTCGRRGCFEAYASNAGLRRAAAEAGVPNAESITVTALFARTDEAAVAAQRFYAEHLGNGITDVINLFQTHEMVLKGEFTTVGDAIMQPVMEIIMRDQFTKMALNKCRVRFANTEKDTVLMGAALIGR